MTYFTEKLCEDRRKRFKFGPGRYVQPYLFESVHPAGDKYGDSDDEADVEHPHGHLETSRTRRIILHKTVTLLDLVWMLETLVEDSLTDTIILLVSSNCQVRPAPKKNVKNLRDGCQTANLSV